MWAGFQELRADPDYVSATAELLESTARRLILLVTATYVVGYIVATEYLTGELVVSYFPVPVILAAACGLALWLLPRSQAIAQVVWQFGLAAVITLMIYVSQQADVAFLYTMLPLMAVLTLGWQAGVFAESLLLLFLWWLWRGPVMPPISTGFRLVVAGGGAFAVVVGWSATNALLTVTQWSLFSARHAQQKVEELRDQRVELKQTQQDLILASQELARLSDRLKAMYQVAEEARRAKEEFVANVSHELRTPLNMIIGFAEMVTELPQVYGAKLPATLLADISAIQRNSQHLARLVDDVLDLSQVDAGRMALSKEWTSLSAVIDEAVLATRTLYASKGLYLEADVPADLPQVFCDSTRIRQVVLNLLSNAGRFTQRGGVRVCARREGDRAIVSVTDSGPGIAPEDQKRLFEPFQQLGDSSRRHDGSGLGLSISKQFVEMHGGKMWLESQIGHGTTFLFSLPLVAAPPIADDGVLRWFNPYQEYEPRRRRSRAPVPQVVPRYVLWEEGDALQRLFSRYIDGIDLVAVRNNEQALRELSRSPARALVVNSPSLRDATGLPYQLPRLPYDTPAIACWAPGPDEAAKRLGVVRYLTKPVSRSDLLGTLQGLGADVESVLLVDDEPEVLQLFARMLSAAERRYRILQATNGRRALRLLRERRPDVLLLDLIMPVMDGFQLLREKAQDATIRDIPTVVVSSQDPAREAFIGNTLTVTCSGGLSVRSLLGCVQAISGVLSPEPGRPEPAKAPGE